MELVETYHLTCPWCGSPTEVTIDRTAGSQELVEDCHVCCSPMLVSAQCDSLTGALLAVSAVRENA
ncbi:MAG: CPXCG motif-containing cysteine-rich protein [Pseudomonadota bacterium]|nr:CPXCG motif-containing cysteine-rich protein [Pseudomonadota bacterium]